MYSSGDMQTVAATAFSAYASVATSLMLFRSIASDMIPEPVKSAVLSALDRFFTQFLGRFFKSRLTQVTLVVDDQIGISRNHIYDAAEVYLRTVDNPDSDRFKVNKSSKQKNINISMEKNQQVFDFFKGIKLQWQFVLVEAETQSHHFQAERRYFELTFDKLRKDDVINEYLPFVLATAKEIKDNERAVKLYTRGCPFDDDGDDCGNGGGYWGCINLDHPSTFDKLAMDPSLKRSIIEDLDRFLRRKEYYKQVGKAWKRGYLLYGPPGTGKSSLIAAMANYLKFDVYDLELTSLYSNSELRRILLSTTNKSILVIEDIDCSVQMHDREGELGNGNSSDTKVTLSGLLNFIDGLWSTCGDERIVIFTTNHKDKLDPALLRPGRMDMHIHMGYCTPDGFDVLASNYLGIKDFIEAPIPEIKRLIAETEITPAEIAEHLMRSDEANVALDGVIELLHKKKEARSLSFEMVTEEAKEKVSSNVVESEKVKENKRKLMRIPKTFSHCRRRIRSVKGFFSH